ncbi:MAG: hypothetical protein VX498_05475, partial [Myxococcota bacterium]|nr:hypothetical protein [Myxococcota bacterium]
MGRPLEIQVQFRDLGALRTAWGNYISHGALMAEIHPPPELGVEVVACVTLKGTKGQARLPGRVIQSASSATILQLESLSDEARACLASFGVREADPAAAGSLSDDGPDSSKSVEEPSLEADSAVSAPPAPAPSAAVLRPVSQSSARPPKPVKPAAASGDLAGGLGWAIKQSGRELRAQEPRLPEALQTGEVGEVNWRDSLTEFYLERATGIVAIHGFRENRWLFLVDGSPAHCVLEKAHPGEHIIDCLPSGAVPDPARWQQACSEHEGSEFLAAEQLVAEGVLDRDVLDEALHRRTVAVTRNLVRANFGDWSFHPAEEIRKLLSWPVVDVLEVLLDAERRNIGQRTDEQIVRETEPYLSQHVTLVPERSVILGELALIPRERVVANELLSGGWTIKELFVYAELQEQELLRLLWVLRSLGILIMLESEGERSKRNRAERQLYIGHRDITRRPVFEALHCHWTAIEEEIEAGYQRVLNEFSEERFDAVADERIVSLIESIHSRAAE